MDENSQRRNAKTTEEEAAFIAAPSYSLPRSLSDLSPGVLHSSQPERGNSTELRRLPQDDFIEHLEQRSANTLNSPGSGTSTYENDQPKFFEGFDRMSLESSIPQHELECCDNSPSKSIIPLTRHVVKLILNYQHNVRMYVRNAKSISLSEKFERASIVIKVLIWVFSCSCPHLRFYSYY